MLVFFDYPLVLFRPKNRNQFDSNRENNFFKVLGAK